MDSKSPQKFPKHPKQTKQIMFNLNKVQAGENSYCKCEHCECGLNYGMNPLKEPNCKCNKNSS